MDHLVIIDGHHLLYRAYWAIPRTFRTRAGEQTNAVFGMASMILAILQQEQPDAMLLCFDAGSETFRHQENETYKDGRAETPDDFYVQIPRAMELIDAMGLKKLSDPQYEADDFLATYAAAARKEGMRVTIVTGDRDAFQLASEHVRIAIPHKGYQQAEYLGPAEVLAKYGIRPDQVASYKGLCGDSSDNLPGVHGIGPKTAAGLLQKYDTLTEIYEHINDIKPSVREKLVHDKDQAFFCERMAQLVSDISLPMPVQDLKLQGLPGDGIIQFFRQMEFTLLTRRFETFRKTPYGERVFGTSTVASDTQESAQEAEAKSQLSLF